MKNLGQSAPLRTASAFAIFGILWIILTDRGLELIVPHTSHLYAEVQTVKGWLFILISSLLIYFVVRQQFLAKQRALITSQAQASLITDVTDSLAATDLEYRITTWNPASEVLFGWTAEEALGKRFYELIPFQPSSESEQVPEGEVILRQGRWAGELLVQRKDKSWIPVQASISLLHDSEGSPTGFVAITSDVSLLKGHEEELIRRNRALLTIRACNRALVRTEREQDLLDEICRVVVIHGAHRLAWAACPIQEGSSELRLAAGSGMDEEIQDLIRRRLRKNGGFPTFASRAFETGEAVVAAEDRLDDLSDDLDRAYRRRGVTSLIALPLKSGEASYGVLVVGSNEASAADPQKRDLLEEIAADLAFGIQAIRTKETRAAAERDLLVQRDLLSDTERLSKIGGWQFDTATRKVTQTDEVFRIYGLNPGDLDASNLEMSFRFFPPEDRVRVVEAFERATRTGEPYDLELQFNNARGERVWVRTVARAEKVDGKVVRVYGNFMDITEKKRSEARIKQQLERIYASREIDQVITATFDERLSLNVLLLHAVTLLQVDAARVLVAQASDGRLTCVSAVGFRTKDHDSVYRRLMEGYGARAVAEGRPIAIYDPSEEPGLTEIMSEEGFSMLYGAPLHVKGKFIGVLEAFMKTPAPRDSSWLDYLGSLANQAAIAIDNATLFRDLQKSNQSMAMAYDATIEGLSRALDLRDKETEGHSRRVTEKTLMLARAMHLPEEDLIHIRRGALLHDIGKMGIPDAVLLKPGPLDANEWSLMKMHPQLAYDMLSPIHHLQPALDIPYCHHERWDGSGYPRGLKGEQIPLSARLFAVVDVWDALLSDRPYRKGWPLLKVLDHIHSQSGSHFDPAVVKLFLALESSSRGEDRRRDSERDDEVEPPEEGQAAG